ncbi:MAG TPA: VWA domain-containing protein [Halanaerobiaceae bacterium]|nr:VWA domain-containing protein [Bacillota bacterium]HHU93009.1 VWA domain-containing protein [Halanaerobiaceae bacterium]HOA40977.1 VWA domain-containing protein [Halanaerobiales bacterium]HPZ63140.1 VWA domain-containing protein [Halanaerobiales bacterium]HQD04398.1 VWA domain-containing protein [Halanaerobiales bacterium]
MKFDSIKIVLVCLLVLGFFLGAYEGIWRQGALKVANYNVDLVEEEPAFYLEVIWDASGSMWGRDYGVEKIIKSKEVLKTFTDELPENVNIALRIFGARRVGDLEDSFLAIPFDNENREDMVNFITNVKPLGKSPIGYSLIEACKDLQGIKGKKYILLISDGIDNGEIPPDKVIEEVIQNEIILHVVHIGEPENPGVKEGLKEMAEKTGGLYFTYNNHEKVIATFRQE